MSSGLPSENSLDKTVETFGLGTYDYPQSGLSHGEDSNTKKSERSLPDDGGSLDPFGPDRLLSYPDFVATSMMPGHLMAGPRQKTPAPSHYDSVVHSVSHSELPNEDPVPRASYYDKMTVGQSVDDMFAKEDAGVYAAESEESEESLPSLPDNYAKFDNSLNSLGNYWSGYSYEDQAVSAGFPSTEFENEQRWTKTNASQRYNMNKIATNIPLVRDLTKSFLKEYGKKDLTRRHVMSFLQRVGSYQFLASDIIRCLRQDHDIQVRDVLDEFPVTRTASGQHLSSLRNKLISLEIDYIRDPVVSNVFRQAAADLTRTIALLEKAGAKNG